MSLGASAPPPLSFSSAAARAVPANTIHLLSVQAVASRRRISVLRQLSTKAAEPLRRPTALRLLSAKAVASCRRNS
eukprot:4153105-Pleurochrysis_carterae.AAC.1